MAAPRRPREPVYRVLELIAHGLHHGQAIDLTFEGLENIPETGGAVLTINHTGYVDFLPAALGAYRRRRRIRFMIKSEVMDVWIMRFLVNHTRTVPVDRSEGAQAFRAAVDTLRDGEIVAVYPEATISRSFELKEFKTGAARMAALARVPVIPMIVWGSHRQWTKGGRRAMGRKHIPVLVRVGEPLTIGVDEDDHAATERIRGAMHELLLEVQDAYGEHPAGEFWVPARLGGSAPTPEAAAIIEDEEARQKAAARAARAHERKGTPHE